MIKLFNKKGTITIIMNYKSLPPASRGVPQGGQRFYLRE